jgi:hypothetical protein
VPDLYLLDRDVLLGLVLAMLHGERGTGSMVVTERRFVEYCQAKCEESNDTQKIMNLMGTMPVFFFSFFLFTFVSIFSSHPVI